MIRLKQDKTVGVNVFSVRPNNIVAMIYGKEDKRIYHKNKTKGCAVVGKES